MSDFNNTDKNWVYSDAGLLTVEEKAYYSYSPKSLTAADQSSVIPTDPKYSSTKNSQWIICTVIMRDFGKESIVRIASIPTDSVPVTMYVSGKIAEGSSTVIDVGLAHPATELEYQTNSGRIPLYSTQSAINSSRINEYQKYFGTVNDDRIFTETGVVYPKIESTYRGLQQFSGVFGEERSTENDHVWYRWKEGVCGYSIADTWDNRLNDVLKEQAPAAEQEYKGKRENLYHPLPSKMDIILTTREKVDNVYATGDILTIVMNVRTNPSKSSKTGRVSTF